MENARLSGCPMIWAVKRGYIAGYAITFNLQPVTREAQPTLFSGKKCQELSTN
jgi:hypothetical protein